MDTRRRHLPWFALTLAGLPAEEAGAQSRPDLPADANMLSVRQFGALGDGRTDDSVALQKALDAAAGRHLHVPAGNYMHSATLTISKNGGNHPPRLSGEVATQAAGPAGSILTYTGNGTQLRVGTDDGNPDKTGKLSGARIEHLTLVGPNGAQTAIHLQNNGMCVIENVRTRGHGGPIFWLRANVITEIRGCDIQGQVAGTGCIGIDLDSEYFGNFVTRILDNHIYQVNVAQRFTGGRYVLVQGNVYENIRRGTGTLAQCGVFQFATGGYISGARILQNYAENHEGYVFEGSAYTGALMELVVRDNEFHGSVDPANPNPALGNLPRTKVLEHDIANNFVPDAEWNARLKLGKRNVFPSTAIFDPATTILADQVTNKKSEEALVYALQSSEMLRSRGEFTVITGGAPGVLGVEGSSVPAVIGNPSSAPKGWSAATSGSAWNAVLQDVAGGWCCYVPGGGSTFDLANLVVDLGPANGPHFLVLGLTVKGWAALKVNGKVAYDTNGALPDWKTEVVKLALPGGPPRVTLTLATNGNHPSFWAEVRLWQIRSGEFNEPGLLGDVLVKAVRRLMKRGVY